jgi:hypothetical protein
VLRRQANVALQTIGQRLPLHRRISLIKLRKAWRRIAAGVQAAVLIFDFVVRR